MESISEASHSCVRPAIGTIDSTGNTEARILYGELIRGARILYGELIRRARILYGELIRGARILYGELIWRQEY